MKDQPLRRYQIWTLADDEKSGRQKAEPASPPLAPSRPFAKIDDLAALRALDNYGPIISITLAGTFTMPNGRSLICRTKTISPVAAHIAYGTNAAPAAKQGDEMRAGSTVHLEIDRIGPFSGVVASENADGFWVAVDKGWTPTLRTKLAPIAVEHGIKLDGIPPVAAASVTKIRPNTNCNFIDHTGTLRRGVIVKISAIDAQIDARIIPPVASRIVVLAPRRHAAEITSISETGFDVRFSNPIPQDEL